MAGALMRRGRFEETQRYTKKNACAITVVKIGVFMSQGIPRVDRNNQKQEKKCME
jgi:hypothetical protein